MNRAFTLALAAALVNVFLSLIVPCMLKEIETKKGSIISEIKLSFMINRHMLLTSSIVTAILVYLAVQIEPEVKAAIPEKLLNFLE